MSVLHPERSELLCHEFQGLAFLLSLLTGGAAAIGVLRCQKGLTPEAAGAQHCWVQPWMVAMGPAHGGSCWCRC